MTSVMKPSRSSGYVRLLDSGELEERVNSANQHLESCDLCACHCGVNRLQSIEKADCRTGEKAVVCSFGPHYGEEQPISGWAGSGAIFFGRCSLHCVFCQDWTMSQTGSSGQTATPEEIASMMLALQDRGCHNINLISPSHVVAQTISAVLVAAKKGLRLPLVYNTGGYDSLEALRLLDGIIDIYLPDMKYGNSEASLRFSGVKDYTEVNRAAVLEMHRQVGDLIVDTDGVATRGLLVRHLVLPGNVAGSAAVLDFIAQNISLQTYLNLMDDYYTFYRASDFPPIDRCLRPGEFPRVLEMAEQRGLRRLDEQHERRLPGI